VLSNLGSAIDLELAGTLRARGIAVLEGTRSGLLAFRHLLEHAAHHHHHEGNENQHTDRAAAGERQAPDAAARRSRAAQLLAAGASGGASLLALLSEYGIAVPRTIAVSSAAGAVAAATAIGYPVVLKTDEPSVRHKTEVGGVLLGVAGAAQVEAGYADLAGRIGPRVVVCQTAPAGIELALGIARDAELGPLLVVGAGGVLVELLADRAVALPPVGPELAAELVGELKVARLLAGLRGAPAADMAAVIKAITGLSQLAVDLGDQLEALDVNPLICGPAGAIGVDALAILRTPS
jgi:acetate---CoA ligase (ADP-forming)